MFRMFRTACESGVAVLAAALLLPVSVAAQTDRPPGSAAPMPTESRETSGASDGQVLWWPVAFQEAVPPVPAVPAAEQPERPADLLELSLEQLATQPVRVPGPVAAAAPLALEQLVTTVERVPSTVGRSPAAVFVITPDMIRRTGATTIPQALRMVPGMDVAQVDSSRWAVSARGFNSTLSNKMLVQIDGRNVYNPLFSGVFWEAQDLFLQDVERIEVVRGPGATVWGANAVNGVVNIITKSAVDTQGGLITGLGGTRSQDVAGFRYGGKIGEDLYYRVWGKWFEGGTFFSPDGKGHDDWRLGHGGFRMDWLATEADTITFQGDILGGDFGRTNIVVQPTPPFRANLSGDDSTTTGDLLCRWRHQVGERSDWALLLYYDDFHRNVTVGEGAAFHYNTFDLDFQQQFPLTSRQQLVYGFGYRFIDIGFQAAPVLNGFLLSATPSRDVNYYSAFVQDEVTLVKDRLFFTTGCKLLENDFSGFEYQPTGRLLWSPDERHSAWGAVSRAVRIPNFAEQNVQLALLPTFPPALRGAPVFPRVINNPGLISEDMLAYELGYRAQATEAFSWDLALFYNVYDNLATGRPGRTLLPGPVPGTFVLPVAQENGLNGESYGVELAANWKLTEWWRLYGNYTFLHLQLHRALGLPSSAEAAEGQSPQNQAYLQSSWDLTRKVEFDLIARYVDFLPGFDPPVPSYISMDLRLAWRPRPNLEMAVVGQNLLQANHLEFGSIALVPFPRSEVPRGVYGMVTCKW